LCDTSTSNEGAALAPGLTIALLIRYHSGSVGAAGGSGTGVSLLARGASARSLNAIDDAVVGESRKAGF